MTLLLSCICVYIYIYIFFFNQHLAVDISFAMNLIDSVGTAGIQQPMLPDTIHTQLECLFLCISIKPIIP